MKMSYVKKVKEKLEIELGVKLIIGGSYALKHHYKLLDRAADDVDLILINANKDKIKRIKDYIKKVIFVENYIDNSNNPYTDYTSSKQDLNIKFNLGHYTFNIMEDLDKEYRVISGNFMPLLDILKAKKRYNRQKDKEDLLTIISKILK